MMEEATSRTVVRRKRDRARHEREFVNAVLDEALVCHVGFMADHGPIVLPMTFARVDDVVYFHGAAGNALLRNLASGAPACVTVTLLDGLVLARSAFHHSMNYRSVVLIGSATEVTDPDEVRHASDALLEHLAPGRSRDARPPSDEEIRATRVLRFPVAEWSAKAREGGPIDDPDDLDLPVWAGVLPLALTAGAAETDGTSGEPPEYIADHSVR